MTSVQSRSEVTIEMPTPNPDEVLVQITLADFGGETSSAERSAVSGLLMQAAQLIGSGSRDDNLRDGQGQIVGRFIWGSETHTGQIIAAAKPEEPPPEEVTEPPPEGATVTVSRTTVSATKPKTK